MSKHSRSKGKRGERKARELLQDRDWLILANTADGDEVEDMIVESPNGIIYSVEVKNRKLIDIVKFKEQAKRNADKKRKPWMVMAKIETTSSWLICMKNEKPRVWHEKEAK